MTYINSNHATNRKFDLEERTFRFAKDIRNLLFETQSNRISPEDKKQLIRSSASVGANYIEANEAISPKDFLLRIKICKKEAKESYFWLRLIEEITETENKEKFNLYSGKAWN